jgi:hypothetical protein
MREICNMREAEMQALFCEGVGRRNKHRGDRGERREKKRGELAEFAKRGIYIYIYIYTIS